MAAGETVLETLVTRLGYRQVGDRDLKTYEQSLIRIRRRMDGFARHANRIGVVGIAALTKVGRTAYSFDREMNALQAATGYTADQMAKLNALARQLGRDTPFSASQAAMAMKLLGQAGLNLEEIIAAIPHTLTLAAAGSMNMAQAAEVAAGTMRGFGLEAQDVGRIADVFAKVSTMAKTTVSDMGQAMPNVAALAATLGVSIEKVAAMAAVLQNSNIQAAESGIGVRNLMSMLISLSGPAEEAIRRLHLDPQDIVNLAKQGKAIEALEMLKTAGFGAAEAADIFGRRVMNHALIIANNLPMYRKLLAANMAAAGSAKQMMEINLQGLPGAWDRLVSAYESFELTLASSGVRTTLTGTMDAIRELLAWFEGLGAGVHRTVGVFLTLMPLLVVVGGAVRVLAWALSPMARMVMALALAFGTLQTTLAAGGLPALIAGIVAGFRAFSVALVATPIGRVVTAVAILVTGILAFRSALDSLFSPLREWAAANPETAAGLRTLATAFGVVAGAVGAVRLAMWAASAAMLTTPFGWLLTSIAAVAAALAYLILQWDTVRDSFAAGARWVGNALFGWLPSGAEPALSGGLPVAPATSGLSGPARAAAEQAYAGHPQGSRNSLTVGSINVTVPGGDPKEIAQNVGQVLTDQMQNVVDNVDGIVER